MEHSYLVNSPGVLQGSTDEQLTLCDTCLSPTTTVQGSENFKVSPVYNIRRIRREPSFVGLVTVRLCWLQLSLMCPNHPPTVCGLSVGEEIAQGCRGQENDDRAIGKPSLAHAHSELVYYRAILLS